MFRKVPLRKVPLRKVPFRKVPFHKVPFHFVSQSMYHKPADEDFFRMDNLSHSNRLRSFSNGLQPFERLEFFSERMIQSVQTPSHPFRMDGKRQTNSF